MAREKIISEIEYVFNSYSNWADIRSWSDEMSRLAKAAVAEGKLTAREAHSLCHTGRV